MLTHLGTIPLHTSRLVLKPLSMEDVPEMFREYARDEKMTHYLSWEPYTDIEALRQFIATRVTPQYDGPEYYHWGIWINGEFTGTINLHALSNRQEYCELGYCISSRWWSKGIMTEAVGTVLRFAFGEIGFHKVCALHDTQNMASGRVMIKNGMVQEGLLRQHNRRKDGTWYDLAFYGILKDEWLRLREE